MSTGSRDPPDDNRGEERPSKSARKRAAHAVQELGEMLLRLSDAELAALDLPEPLREALRSARSIRSRGAALRQRQYIGKLMRTVDAGPIRAALAARSAQAARESERLRRAEHWRERLIAEGEPALAELARWRPELDLDEWRRRIAAARSERASAAAGGAAAGAAAGRELFRALRALFATMS
jgi:ribosome-associated protein